MDRLKGELSAEERVTGSLIMLKPSSNSPDDNIKGGSYYSEI